MTSRSMKFALLSSIKIDRLCDELISEMRWMLRCDVTAVYEAADESHLLRYLLKRCG